MKSYLYVSQYIIIVKSSRPIQHMISQFTNIFIAEKVCLSLYISQHNGLLNT